MKITKLKDKIIYKVWRKYREVFYPCILEIHLADHCNLNCKGCNHYSPIADKKCLDYDNFKENLQYLKGLKINFRLLGGEPLLNQDIEKIINLIRSEFKKSKIEVITNGILLQKNNQEKISPTFLKTCRDNKIRISITKYPINLNYKEIINLLIKNKIKVKVFGDHSNNGCFNKYLLKKNRINIKENFNNCNEISCLQLVEDKIFGCPESAYSYLLNKKFNTNFEITDKDYINIKEIKKTRQIRKFRMNPKPFCGYCVLPREDIKWCHSNGESSEWIAN